MSDRATRLPRWSPLRPSEFAFSVRLALKNKSRGSSEPLGRRFCQRTSGLSMGTNLQ